MAETGRDFVEETIDFWEPIMGRRMTRIEAHEVIENVVNLIRILMEWEAADQMPAERPRRRKVA